MGIVIEGIPGCVNDNEAVIWIKERSICLDGI